MLKPVFSLLTFILYIGYMFLVYSLSVEIIELIELRVKHSVLLSIIKFSHFGKITWILIFLNLFDVN